ncbi:MAG: hypothetical protein RIC84_15000 [Aggregatilineales bacterium]
MTKTKRQFGWSFEMVINAPLQKCISDIHHLKNEGKTPLAGRGQLEVFSRAITPDHHKFQVRFTNKFPMVLRGRMYTDENFGTTVITGRVLPLVNGGVVLVTLVLAGLGVYALYAFAPCSLVIAVLMVAFGGIVFQRDYQIYRNDADALITKVEEKLKWTKFLHELPQTAHNDDQQQSSGLIE